jgi:hypothetical protein
LAKITILGLFGFRGREMSRRAARRVAGDELLEESLLEESLLEESLLEESLLEESLLEESLLEESLLCVCLSDSPRSIGGRKRAGRENGNGVSSRNRRRSDTVNCVS